MFITLAQGEALSGEADKGNVLRLLTTTFAASDTQRMSALLDIQRMTSNGEEYFEKKRVFLTFEGLLLNI
jgi:hypothetical protein